MSNSASDKADAAEGHASPHGGGAQLVKMANDIGNFFRAEPVREDAIVGITNHMDKYWTKRMRDKLAAHLKTGEDAKAGEDVLDELPLEAFRRLMAPAAKTG
jgi:formate dehydrogenase subunit delta